MIRVVGGVAGGRRLTVPPAGTRPTSDRAREALFNTLAGLLDVAGARVLDLFAGSGAVGLEALSRGASEVWLVESDGRAAAVARANADGLGLPGARVVKRRSEVVLAARADAPFDLVFADPPYALAATAVDALLSRLASGGWLAPGAVVVVERAARDDPPTWPNGFDALKQKRYGDGMLWYGRAAMSDRCDGL